MELDDSVRLKTFKFIYRGLPYWQAYRETRGPLDTITTPDGEEVSYYDLLAGIDTLPRRQRQAFELIYLRDLTQRQATDVMMPGHRWQVVQEYAQLAIQRMLHAYDDRQRDVQCG